ncbi:hypothetical protein ACIQGZ_03955 [Streptomyces sp. NPDC092296]|uniref:hypothetical protein n=1 Tax=Streptomyces sp. NPDC092296 TaxID=3366012 RepID=UPI003803A5B4
MNRSLRVRLALSAALPTLVALLACGTVLAATGLLPWSVLPAVLIALAVQGVVTYHRLGAAPDRRD